MDAWMPNLLPNHAGNPNPSLYWPEQAFGGYARWAHEQIREKYESGAKLFTKEAIRDLHMQLGHRNRAAELGETIKVKGLHGKVVELELLTGKLCPNDSYRWLTDAQIHYVPYFSLTNNLDYFPTVTERAFCPLRIEYTARPWNKQTKAYVFPEQGSREDGTRFFQYVNKDVWGPSQTHRDLRELLLSLVIPRSQKVIAFARGGTLYPYQYQPAIEHAMALSVRNILSEYGERNDNIESYFQDPTYTEVDRNVLEDNGMKVLQDPDGFLEADESSVVIACRQSYPFKDIICDIARPVMIIWAEMEQFDSPRVKQMIAEDYDDYDFPAGISLFQDLAIYIRNY